MKISPEEIKNLAQEIYVHQLTNIQHSFGLNHWDYEPVAEQACQAAEAFTRIIAHRFTPQTLTPLEGESSVEVNSPPVIGPNP